MIFSHLVFGVRYLQWNLTISEFVPRRALFGGSTPYQEFFHFQSSNLKSLIKKRAISSAARAPYSLVIIKACYIILLGIHFFSFFFFVKFWIF